MIGQHPELCQLAGVWNGEIPDDGAFIERKWDGWRCLFADAVDGSTRLRTRNGIPIMGAGHIQYRLGLMERMAGERMVFDGEFQVDGTLAATKAWCERGWKSGGEAGLFHAFDCMTMREWFNGGSEAPYYQRKARLRELAQAVEDDPTLSWEWRPGSKGRDEGASPVIIMPEEWVFTASDAVAFTRRVWAEGGEGGMVKNPYAPYQRTRSKDWQKIKPGGPWMKKI